MRTLVTGGAGYIGSVTADALLRRGHEVTVLDDLRTGHRDAVPGGARFVLADVAERALVGRTLREAKIEAVIHFAASSLVSASMADPVAYFANNTGASLALLEAMLDHEVQLFVFSSTAAVYGTPRDVPIPETADVRPESVYGESKVMTERMVSWLARTRDLGSVSLRYFNAAGATADLGEDHRPETHLIPLVLEAAEGRRDEIRIFGHDYDTPDGTAIRDYVHVSDLAEAHVRALEALRPGERRTYNVGTGHGYSVEEVVEACREVTGRDILVRDAPRRPGDPPRLVADAGRIHDELGWRPRIPELRDIIGSAWRWRRAHPEGYAA